MKAPEYFELRDRVRSGTATPGERRRLSNERNRQVVRLLGPLGCKSGDVTWATGDLSEQQRYCEPQS